MSKRLLAHPLFAGWSEAERESLVAKSCLAILSAGHTIFKRGQKSTHFYLIDQGQVQLQLLAPNGFIKKYKVLKEGESVGDAYVLLDQPYRVDAVTRSSVQLLSISKHDFFACLVEQPHLMQQLIATLSERLYGFWGDVLSTNTYSGTQRVINYLLGDLDLANGIRVTLTCPKAQIAAALNLTPEHFSRVLNDLSSRGLISVDGRHIELVDVDGLCAYER